MPTLIRHIETKILILRGQKVLLSTHLAELYGVLPKALVQAVKRNAERFPSDLMFQLSAGEFANLKSQNCDRFTASTSAGLSRTRESSGNRLALRFTCSFSRLAGG